MDPWAGLHILAHRSISLPYLPNLCAVLHPAPLASYYFPFLSFTLLSPCIRLSLGRLFGLVSWIWFTLVDMVGWVSLVGWVGLNKLVWLVGSAGLFGLIGLFGWQCCIDRLIMLGWLISRSGWKVRVRWFGYSVVPKKPSDPTNKPTTKFTNQLN